MRQHRALGLARRARRIELDRDVLRADRHLRIVAALRIAPGRKILPFRRAAFGGDDDAYVGQIAADVADLGDELRPTNSTGALQSPTMKATSGPASRQFTGAITTSAFIAPISSSK